MVSSRFGNITHKVGNHQILYGWVDGWMGKWVSSVWIERSTRTCQRLERRKLWAQPWRMASGSPQTEIQGGKQAYLDFFSKYYELPFNLTELCSQVGIPQVPGVRASQVLLVSLTWKDLMGGLWSCQQLWPLPQIIYSFCFGFCYWEGQANWVFLAIHVS